MVCNWRCVIKTALILSSLYFVTIEEGLLFDSLITGEMQSSDYLESD